MNRFAVVESAENWLFNRAFPFWMEHGVDRRNGGFIESLSLAGSDSGAPFKRTRVTCRQIYVFCQAETLGVEGAREIVQHGLDFLTGPTWLGENKGFARRVSRTGEELDPTPDLYDYAFIIFALSWGYKITKDETLREWAHIALDCAERFLRDANGKGFWHDADREGWRQQNPHMHLLEGALVAVEVFGDDRFAALADEVVGLFRTTFFDHANGVLPEFFDPDWSSAPGRAGSITEPGHQYEWAWILFHCNRLIGVDSSEIVRRLIASADAHGINQSTGLVYNAVDRSGQVLDAGQRSWPNTERLKAACALYELDGVDPLPIFDQALSGLLQYHLCHNPEGTWIDMFDDASNPTSQLIPSSTLYHVVLGFAETLRISAKLRTE